MRPLQSVTIAFDYGRETLDDLLVLTGKLEAALKKEGAGKFGDHDMANDLSDGTITMYGTDAELVYKAARPVLRNAPFMKGATATIRYGMVDGEASEITVAV